MNIKEKPMIKFVVNLLQLLNKSERKQFFIIQLLMVTMALLEMFSIISIGPYLSIINNPNEALENKIVLFVYHLLGSTDWNDFILKSGFLILFLFLVSALTSVVTTWKMSIFGSKLGANIGDRLYRYYLNNTWTFHLLNSNSYLTKQISTESTRLSHAVIAPILQINAKIIILLVLLSAVFIKNPIGAIGGTFVFVALYLFIYKYTKNILSINGNKITTIMAERFKLLSDGFGVIKEIILAKKQEKFVMDFERNGEKLAFAQAQNQYISLMPKYIIEFFAYSAIIIYSLWVFNFSQLDNNKVLAELIVYMFLGFKILPNIQQLYGNISIVKGNISAFHAISNDLYNSDKKINNTKNTYESKPCLDSIIFQSVSYHYPNKKNYSIEDITLSFEAKKIYGIVGHSGSGKSTLIDLLLGLISPSKGIISLNEESNSINSSDDWQSQIGFVPQDVRLIDGTLIENIALGVKDSEVDLSRLNQAIELADLDDIIQNLDNGLNTKVGERGLNLSGGQKQRISIARALYNEPEILIFDEATSALDGISEKKIMDSITNIAKNKTVVLIAHRLNTVINCNMIYMLENGKLIDKGTFENLKNSNVKFEEMVNNS